MGIAIFSTSQIIINCARAIVECIGKDIEVHVNYQWARWVVTSNGEISIWYSIKVVIGGTLSAIANHANRTVAVVITDYVVNAILSSLAVVLISRTWISQDTFQWSSLHIAFTTWPTLKTSLDSEKGCKEV